MGWNKDERQCGGQSSNDPDEHDKRITLIRKSPMMRSGGQRMVEYDGLEMTYPPAGDPHDILRQKHLDGVRKDMNRRFIEAAQRGVRGRISPRS